MTRIALHFAHANGFPGGCYRKLYAALGPGYDVVPSGNLGTDPRYPITDGWRRLADQLIDGIRAAHRRPVVGVGHSLGGYLMFLAAVKHPELFRAIVILDAPLIGPLKSTGLALTKRLGLVERVTPGRGTLNRRKHWPDEAAALAHFRHRKVFRTFDPECLEDYVRHGMRHDARGVHLLIPPEVEHRIYLTVPHDLPVHRGRLDVPAGFVVGSRTTVVGGMDLAYMKREFGMRFKRVEGGHLFPFERPAEAARAIRTLVEQLL